MANENFMRKKFSWHNINVKIHTLLFNHLEISIDHVIVVIEGGAAFWPGTDESVACGN